MTAVTAITAQNTVEVAAVHPLPPAVVIDQVRAVVDDIGVDAVKVGMLGDVATIEAVREALGLVGAVPVVVDPVMVSESGSVLLREDARDALREQDPPARHRGHTQSARGARAGGSTRRAGRPRVGQEDPGTRAGSGGGHRGPPGARVGSVLRRSGLPRDRGRAPPWRRGPWVGLHTLVGAGGVPGSWAFVLGGGAAGARRCSGCGEGRAAVDRPRAGPVDALGITAT